MNTKPLTVKNIQEATRSLLDTYGFLGAVLFGSYADGTATEKSDVDIFLSVPQHTKPKRIFEFAYDLGEVLGTDVDAYGSHEVLPNSDFYNQIHSKGITL